MSCTICFGARPPRIAHDTKEPNRDQRTHDIHLSCLARCLKRQEEAPPFRCPVCVASITEIHSEGTTYRITEFVEKILKLEETAKKKWIARLEQARSEWNWPEIKTLLKTHPDNLDRSLEPLFSLILEKAIEKNRLKILPLLFQSDILPLSTLGTKLIQACQTSHPRLIQTLLSISKEIPAPFLNLAIQFARTKCWNSTIAITKLHVTALSPETHKDLLFEASKRKDDEMIAFLLKNSNLPESTREEAERIRNTPPSRFQTKLYLDLLAKETTQLSAQPEGGLTPSPAKTEDLASLIAALASLGINLPDPTLVETKDPTSPPPPLPTDRKETRPGSGFLRLLQEASDTPPPERRETRPGSILLETDSPFGDLDSTDLPPLSPHPPIP